MRTGRMISLDPFGDRLDVSKYLVKGSDPEYHAILRDLRKAVELELTGRQRECVQLYYFDGKRMKEAADTLGITEATVSRHIKKARLRLNRVLMYGYKRLA